MTKEFDTRNENKSRSVCAAMAESADTGKRVLSEKERRILDMWPRYEDGEYLWFGDAYVDTDGDDNEVQAVELSEACADLVGLEGFHTGFEPGDRVKRPVQSVLDADGVEIKVGDTVWHEDESELRVIDFGGAEDGETMLGVEYVAGPIKWGEVRCLSVTHTRPAPKVLDADGVEIHVGDTVYGVGRSQHSFDVIDPYHIDQEVGEAFSVRCYDRDEGEECHCRPELLTHARPDSWERLEEDAVKVVCEYAGAAPDEFGDYDCDTCRLFDARSNLICEQLMTREIVRRAKALAGVEVDG